LKINITITINTTKQLHSAIYYLKLVTFQQQLSSFLNW